MASPIAHGFAGFWTFLALAGRARLRLIVSQWRQFLPQLCMLVVVANLADLDIVAGLVSGRDLHHGASHSVLAAIVVSLLCSWFWEIAGGFWRSAAFYFAAYVSHLLIDMFSGTKLGWTGSGSGIPLFWPWHEQFSSPLILVYGVQQREWWSIFSSANVWGRGYELVIFGSITIALVAYREQCLRRKRG